MKQSSGGARPVWPRILGYFLAAMLFLTLLSRAADSVLLPAVRCARPLPGALRHAVALGGVISASEAWPVMAEPDLAVAQVHVRPGQHVKAGEALLEYDIPALQRTLEEKNTALKKLTLQAQLEDLEPIDEEPSSREKRSLTQQLRRLDIDAAQREADRLSQLLYGGAALTAPVDGVVGEVMVKPGSAASGAALRLFPASSGLVVRALVAEDQMEHLKPGMQARYQLSGKARAEEGSILLKALEPTLTGYEAVFDLAGGKGAIGQSVGITAAQITETYDMCVPLGAIAYSEGFAGIYRIRRGQSVLGETEYAEFVNVTVLESDGQYAAIDGALADQDLVVISSSKPLSAGDRVRSGS